MAAPRYFLVTGDVATNWLAVETSDMPYVLKLASDDYRRLSSLRHHRMRAHYRPKTVEDQTSGCEDFCFLVYSF